VFRNSKFSDCENALKKTAIKSRLKVIFFIFIRFLLFWSVMAKIIFKRINCFGK